MQIERALLTEEAPPKIYVPPTARDFLANERTFLAYVRTALAFIGFGFVIARFSLFAREFDSKAMGSQSGQISVTFGVIIAIMGILVGMYGVKRYVDADTALRRSEVAALSPRSAMLIAGIVALFGTFIAVSLFRLR